MFLEDGTGLGGAGGGIKLLAGNVMNATSEAVRRGCSGTAGDTYRNSDLEWAGAAVRSRGVDKEYVGGQSGLYHRFPGNGTDSSRKNRKQR